MIFTSNLGKVNAQDPREGVQYLANYIRKMQEELEYRLAHLDSGNITEIDMDETKIYSGDAELLTMIRESGESYSAILQTVEGIDAVVADLEKGMATTVHLDASGMYVTGNGGRVAITGGDLDLTGSITFADLSSAVQNDINDAYAMAEDAASTAADAADVVDGWRYGSTTYIDGSMLMTDTVMASMLIGGEVSLLTSAERMAGGIEITGSSSSSYAVELYSNGALRLAGYNGDLWLESANAALLLNGDEDSIFCYGGFFPEDSDYYYLGNANYRWAAVYAESGEVDTSDRNKKNSIEDLPEKYVALFDALAPRRYKLNSGTSDRYHVGFISQEVEEAMTAAGITSQEFGGFVKDTDAEGNDLYMLRYAEFIAILAAKIRQMQGEINDLKARIA